jgi:transposase
MYVSPSLTSGVGARTYGLLARFADLRGKASALTGYDCDVIVIQEAGLDDFWIHRVLEQGNIESHVVDPASRRRRDRFRTGD